jgi:hypothetical protein
MTLILTLGNDEQVIQISDRRLTYNGILVEEEYDKSGVIVCRNARMAFGFTGIARYGNFDTERWLLAALAHSAAPDYTIFETLERFKDRCTHDFANIPELKALAPNKKQLSILFSGYLYNTDPPLCGYAILTNYQDFNSVPPNSVAWDHFEITYRTEKKDLSEELTLVERIGFWPAMNSQDESILRQFLRERKPSRAILAKVVEVFKEIADRPKAAGSIGKQLSSITLAKNIDDQPQLAYHSNKVSHKIFTPSQVVATGPDNCYAITGLSIAAVDPKTTRPMVVPKVRRNQLCPCGSGKKYKYCHGDH